MTYYCHLFFVVCEFLFQLPEPVLRKLNNNYNKRIQIEIHAVPKKTLSQPGLSYETSPEEDNTVSSASMCMSPGEAGAAPSPAPTPLYASTPYARPRLTNGHDVVDTRGRSDSDVINGNANVIISESMNSMDVLSGGESDAGDTLSRRNNNSISSSILGTLKESTIELPRRRNCDITYFVAKELLMTERTYKRDLELVTVTWSQKVSELTSEGAEVVSTLARACLALEPLALPSGALLARLERMLSSKATDNEEPEYKKIAELLYEHLSNTADAYAEYVCSAGALAARVESVRRRAAAVRGAAAAFERRAPLPLAWLLLRPLHRLAHLETRLAELCASEAARAALELVSAAARLARDQLRHVENHVALCQLQRDIAGYDKLLVAEREFVRMGCLYKHSTRGLQQRMLFLFTDVLVVTSKCGGTQFRAHAALPLYEVNLESSDLPHSFTLTGPRDTSLLLSASNEHEYSAWRRALQRALERARARGGTLDTDLTPYEQEIEPSSGSLCHVGGGSLAHVCWHRVTSLARDQLHEAMRTQLSGYLLRKFKKSPGWQKLWVVFAAFSLFFYKSWQDDAPLASLPLLGYSVGAPDPDDGIEKDFVFKLQFKNHVYFFRADSHYTYSRWTEVLQTAMTDSSRE